MESLWFIIIVSLCISALIKSTLNYIFSSQKTSNNKINKNLPLPPGPPSFPIIGNSIWLRRPISDMESILRRVREKYGDLVTMRIGPRAFVYVSSHSLAHRALIQNGAVFSDRPAPPPASKVFNRTQKTISSAGYGPTWRLLRRNITNEILNPARVKAYSSSRRWVLSILIRILLDTPQSVRPIDHFQYAMFCLLVLMCFGDKLQENQIKEIERVQRQILLNFRRMTILNIIPRLSKILFCSRWKDLIKLRQDQENVLIPLIKARLQQRVEDSQQQFVAYVDTLVDIKIPEEENRKLDESEMVSLCGEFLNAGTDTTSTAMQWIMANLVKYPNIQKKLYDEIVGVLGRPDHAMEVAVEEEDLQKMPYLKAVVLEGLRRHPPGHFVLPHRVSEDVKLDGYVIPKNTTVNFLVAEMGWDPHVWEDPMEFNPERFLSSGDDVAVDITGSKEIKMMPFGAGRRMCPASGLAMLHLEYFVANLIWYFEWRPVEGDVVDLSEKQEFTTVMKNPLRARICARSLKMDSE